MSDLEQVIEMYTKLIYVFLPCEIVKISGDGYIDALPKISVGGRTLPVIPDIPLIQLGNKNTYIKITPAIGDVVSVFFSQLDFASYLESEDTDVTDVGSQERFNLTNAVALPFNVHKRSDGMLPVSDIEIKGNIKVVDSNVTISGGDITADGISLKNHVHDVSGTDSRGDSFSTTTELPK